MPFVFLYIYYRSQFSEWLFKSNNEFYQRTALWKEVTRRLQNFFLFDLSKFLLFTIRLISYDKVASF